MKILQALILAFSILCFENTFAFENNFFIMDVPETWAHKSYSDTDPAPFKLDYFYKHNCQFFYTYVSKQIPSPKDVINIHVESKLDNTGLESMCIWRPIGLHCISAIAYAKSSTTTGTSSNVWQALTPLTTLSPQSQKDCSLVINKIIYEKDVL